MSHIKTRIPALRETIDKTLLQRRTELQFLGPDLEVEDKKSLLLRLISRFNDEFCDILDGRCFDGCLSGGARLNHIFNDHFVGAIHHADEIAELTPAEVKAVIRNASGPKPPLFISEASFEALVRRQLARLRAPALECVDLVKSELSNFIQSASMVAEIQRFSLLAQELVAASHALLEECYPRCAQMIESLLAIEKAYINTAHPDFWHPSKTISILSRLLEDKRQPRSDEVPVKSIEPNAGFFSSLFRPTPPPPPPLSFKFRCSSSNSLVAPTSLDHFDIESQLLMSFVRSYCDIVRKNLLDSTPKACMHFLVRAMEQDLHARLVDVLFLGKSCSIEDLLVEHKEARSKRTLLERQIAMLRDAAKVLCSPL